MAAITIPVTFSLSAPIPPNFKGSPQDIAQAIVDRIQIDSVENIAFFVTGPVAPTSDVGPWLKDGKTWYVWDDVTGAYIPQPLESLSLRYIAADISSPPDPDDFTFWIVTELGKATDIRYFSTGAWKSIFEDKFAQYSTTTQMNAAITAALAAIQSYFFRADISTAVTLTFGVAGTQKQVIQFSPTNNPFSVWSISDNAFVVPVSGYYHLEGIVHFSSASGDATGITRQINLLRNGAAFDITWQSQASTTAQQLIPWSTNVLLAAGDKIQVEAQVSVDTVTTPPYVAQVEANNNPFSGFIIQKT